MSTTISLSYGDLTVLANALRDLRAAAADPDTILAEREHAALHGAGTCPLLNEGDDCYRPLARWQQFDNPGRLLRLEGAMATAANAAYGEP